MKRSIVKDIPVFRACLSGQRINASLRLSNH
jgi:hypothetical protein